MSVPSNTAGGTPSHSAADAAGVSTGEETLTTIRWVEFWNFCPANLRAFGSTQRVREPRKAVDNIFWSHYEIERLFCRLF
jgi:hypothetical protein